MRFATVTYGPRRQTGISPFFANTLEYIFKISIQLILKSVTVVVQMIESDLCLPHIYIVLLPCKDVSVHSHFILVVNR